MPCPIPSGSPTLPTAPISPGAAETERGLAGFAILDVAAGRIWALFVAPEAEGEGIGRALHDRLIQGAAEPGLDRLCLSTAPRTRAERFYTQAGWNRTGLTNDGEVSFERDIRLKQRIAKEKQG